MKPTEKSYVKYVCYYVTRRKLLHYQAREVYYIIWQNCITLSGDIITLSGSYYISRRLCYIIVKPLLKKPTLDKDILNNYRPVSNLPLYQNWLKESSQNNLICTLMNTHCTTLFIPSWLRIKNDIAETLDKKCTTILVMLHLSAAFDSIVHELLMTRLEQSFGITDKALAWLRSYISDMNQKVVVGSAESGGSVVTCGVPQGSVLGPILYYIYTKPIGRIITRHDMNHHCYADDLQIYLAVDRDESIVTALAKVELCVTEVAA